LFVKRLPDNTVGALPDLLKDIVATRDLTVQRLDVRVLLRDLTGKFVMTTKRLTYSGLTYGEFDLQKRDPFSKSMNARAVVTMAI
jgi:hypothetical protein